MQTTRVLQATTFGALGLAAVIVALGPFLLKSGAILPGVVWLTAAVVSSAAAIVRCVLKSRGGNGSNDWIHALGPSRLGGAIVVAILAFIFVVLPLVALAAE